ncbi:MAG: L-fucose mutarotase [Kiritimatiellia bacterium]|jgi:L-fucose mutarotase|nr:L-fucose mutarotase [Kiritimatiellia bacterium]MDP6630061.1 L-fucose mutarotase [Kiritimatiellia bacterium]MDP6811402.1 L-fucose mutarotase [Kiritimatiellia bacterium]MDP7023802.1 L-fucose mutarotase [Kiritimatiellia bacterium]
MLKGIDPIIAPELLKILAEMGHGDEIVLSDAHFPGHSFCPRNVLRGDGLEVADLLEGIIPLFELDSYDDPLIMMAAVEGDELDPQVEAGYMAAIRKAAPDAPAVKRIDRFAFYERAEKAYACVVTGTTAKYGNIILKKGVTPVGCVA